MDDAVHDAVPAAPQAPVHPDAGAWRRFLARLFDMWLAIFALGFVVSLSMMVLSPALLAWLETPLGAQLFALACMPLIFVLDAAVLAKFGNTPGKALLRLRVVTSDGAALGWGQAVRRNLHMWVAGLGLTIPLINLITMGRQGWRVARGQPASYDEGKYRVLALPLGWGRGISFALLLFFIFATVGTLSRMGSQGAGPASGNRTGTGVGTITTWTNPENGRTLTVGPAWRYTVRDEDGKPVHVFTLQDGNAMVIVATSPSSGQPLAGYTRQVSAALARKVALRGSIEPYRGVPSWAAEGIAADAQATRFVVRVLEHNGMFWNVTTLQKRPYLPTDEAARQLREDLWSTVVAPR